MIPFCVCRKANLRVAGFVRQSVGEGFECWGRVVQQIVEGIAMGDMVGDSVLVEGREATSVGFPFKFFVTARDRITIVFHSRSFVWSPFYHCGHRLQWSCAQELCSSSP